jgi:hypothetical protein
MDVHELEVREAFSKSNKVLLGTSHGSSEFRWVKWVHGVRLGLHSWCIKAEFFLVGLESEILECAPIFSGIDHEQCFISLLMIPTCLNWRVIGIFFQQGKLFNLFFCRNTEKSKQPISFFHLS